MSCVINPFGGLAMRRIPFSHLFLAAAVMQLPVSLYAQTGPAATAPIPATVTPLAKPSANVPVNRIVLFSSGVGYFEHNGSVTGNVTADLRFETAQINDVLKSLVVYDRGGGSVKTITYPANDPVNRTLRSFEVNLSGDPPLADILKQIRGAKVAVTVADESLSGAILGVEAKEKPVGRSGEEKVVRTFVVNIITDSGIRSVSLDDIRKLDILDEKIRKEMNQALAALVQARDQSKKTVTVHFDGNGARSVGMGYLVETPVWKTTYRLLLPDPKTANNADLQAWAIVENQTDNDWENVSLSLVGGRPISYIELLYQPLYISRPVVSPTVIGSIVPQTYDNGFSLNGITVNNVQAPRMNMVQSLNQNSGVYSNSGGNMGGQGFGGGGAGFGGNGGNQGFFGANTTGVTAGLGDAAGNPMADFTQGVAAIAEATKIGEMFHYTVDKVTLPRQESSMIPIVSEAVRVERLSVFSPSVSTKYAMRGIRLYNGTGKYLLGGPVTVMDTVKDGHSYAGDAKIEDIPPGQSRLLSFAIDQESLIQISPDTGDESLVTGSISKGVLWLTYRSQVQRSYALQNKGDLNKTIVLEHPISDGYALKEPEKPVEKTDRVYRFEVKLAARESKTFKVIQERTRSEKMELLNVQNDPLAFYTRQGVIPEKVRAVLQNVAARRVAIADIQAKIQARNADRSQVLQEQGNIRENIKVLPAGSASQEAAIRDLTAHDEDLKKVNKELKDLGVALEGARADLAKYLETTSVE
jgi:hypothetical protein